MGLDKEGIKQAREALEIYGSLDDMVGLANCLIDLALLLRLDNLNFFAMFPVRSL